MFPLSSCIPPSFDDCIWTIFNIYTVNIWWIWKVVVNAIYLLILINPFFQFWILTGAAKDEKRNMGIAGKIKQCYFHPFILTQIDIKTLNLTSWPI